ncbi:MAG: dihydrolipoyl dehydrogenase [Rhodospirillales bacterium]|nr:dihydrolipoyl dehydrogenase [Rhodospirillales bacterium]
MNAIQDVKVPDIGDFKDVEIIEVGIAPGQQINTDDPLITLESDKASMEVPSPISGTVMEVRVAVGDKVSKGSLVCTVEVGDAAVPEPPSPDGEQETDVEPSRSAPASAAASKPQQPAAASQPQQPAAASQPQQPAKPQQPARQAPKPAPKPAARAAERGDIHAEVLVLGSGPGGYTAAFRAADLGLKTVLVERYASLGGVCLNVGCIPSKALLHAAKVIAETKDMGAHGLTFAPPQIDLKKLGGWKDSVVAKLTNGLGGLAKQRKVEVVQGVGIFASPNTLAVETSNGRKVVSFDQAIIAAGSQVAKIPGFPMDDPRVMDSTDALLLEEIPKRLLIVGGGIIGLEMATVYSELGSEITVVEMLDTLMPGADKDIVKPFHKHVEKRYANIFLKTKVARMEATPKGIKVAFEGDKAPKEDTFDRVLVAVGRTPNGKFINAEAAGVEVDQRGFIPVDKQLRTNVPHIFAIGDICGHPMLAHKATHEGKTAAEVCAGRNSAFDARVVPSVAYTDPEVAWVGVTEEEAKAQKIKYGKGVFPWAASGRSLGLGRDEGLTKLIFDEETERVIGAGIVGPSAGDLIAEAALAIEMGCDAADIGLTIHPHPTLSETVAFAAEAYEGTITDLYMPKKKR